MKIQKNNYITLKDVEQNDSIVDYINRFRQLVKTLNLSESEILDLENKTPVYFINTELISKLNKRVIENYSRLDDRIDNNFNKLNDKIDKIVIDSGSITDIQIGFVSYKTENFNYNRFGVVSYLDSSTNKITIDFMNVPDLSELENKCNFAYSMSMNHEAEIQNLKHSLLQLQSELMHRNYESTNTITD